MASAAGSGVARSPVTTSVSNPNVMSSTVSGTRIAMPMSSAAWKSTSQRMPGSTVTASSGVAGGAGAAGSGPTWRSAGTGAPIRVVTRVAAAMAEDHEALREQPGDRRSCPRLGVCRVFGVHRRSRQHDVVGERFVRAVGGVRRGQRRDDPRRPALVVALGELLPDPQPALHRGGVVATTRPPRLVPEVPAPRDLVGCQLGLVGVDVELVGIDAHPQLGVGGVDHEAGLDAQRQEDDRQVDVREAPEQEQLVGFGQGHGRSRVTAGSPGR